MTGLEIDETSILYLSYVKKSTYNDNAEEFSTSER